METYQILGLIGSLLLLILIIPFFAFTYHHAYQGYGIVGRHFYGMMYGMFFVLPFFILIPFALGIIGSFITDKIIAGILLIIASIFSLPIFFGIFGISFILLLIAGILALAKK
ncbi:MAG: hypothetical protein QXW51_02625 [Sulfolobaceae archaeon]